MFLVPIDLFIIFFFLKGTNTFKFELIELFTNIFYKILKYAELKQIYIINKSM